MAQRRTRRNRPKAAFVLGGGGNLGAIQAGMLRALSEHGIEADLVVGCSVGALNGAAYASDPSPVGVERLVDEWTALSEGESLIMPSSFIPSPVQLIRRGGSLHGDEGLEATIKEFLGSSRTFEDLAIPFECVATDMDDAVEKWFSAGELISPIMASAALPAVYPFVEIDARRYIDGGVVNNVPLGRAIELGARKVFVLHVGLHGRPRAEIRRPLDAAMVAYWIARNARFARDLASVPSDVEVVVLPPGERPGLRYDDFEQGPALVAQGFEHADEYLTDLETEERLGRSLAERLTADTRRVVDELVGKVNARREGHRAHAEKPAEEVETEELETALLVEAVDTPAQPEANGS